MRSLFSKLKSSIVKTSTGLVTNIDNASDPDLPREEQLELLEEALITSDLGVNASMAIVESLRKMEWENSAKELKGHIRDAIFDILRGCQYPLTVNRRPYVIMVLGVNGVGKTTTIGKLASKLTSDGKKVILAACDTFRAAAIEQLMIWGERAGCDVIRQKEGSDPGAVAYDAVQAGVARRADAIIIDTAGRLHTKVNLMNELQKIKRVVERDVPGAPHENLLVLDASTGQNAINQTDVFNKAIDVSGIALTKLDGTAKGGIIVAIAKEFHIPLRFIGVGEKIEDLRTFKADEFVDALLQI